MFRYSFLSSDVKKNLLKIFFGTILLLLIVTMIITVIRFGPLEILRAAKIGYWAIASRTPGRTIVQNGSGESISTNYYSLKLDQLDVDDTVKGRGGALDVVGNDIYVGTRFGVFYKTTGDLQELEALSIPSPTDFELLLVNAREERIKLDFGLKDILIHGEGVEQKILAAYHEWHPDRACYTLSVGSYPIGLTSSEGKRWTRIFESDPCITNDTFSFPMEAGGRLVRLPGDKVLVTVGDHAFHRGKYVQDPATSYGKILKISLSTEEVSIYSTGHRNPQGLTVATDGRVWETEHGPRGGDELNLIQQGKNYGWPKRTYGSSYYDFGWELTDTLGFHDDYAKPIMSWSPGLGITNVMEVNSSQFPIWKGDLLLGAMAKRGLMRVRVRENRVVMTESINVGRRVRDLGELDNGKIALFFDAISSPSGKATIAVLSNSLSDPNDQSVYKKTKKMKDDVLANVPVFANCFDCHTIGKLEGNGVGPKLWGLMERDMASASGYVYSVGWPKDKAKWEKEALKRFIRDPASLIEGGKMPSQPYLSEDELDKIVRLLETLQ